MKYKLLMHPTGHETYLDSSEYDTIDDAVKAGMSYGTDDFIIVTVHPWQAVEATDE
jgi:hypothetical protein